jgi:hypothetical protein
VPTYPSNTAWPPGARTPVSWRFRKPAPVSHVFAVLAIAAIIGQLAVAQVTLALAVAFIATAALTRWRPSWLFGPVLAGLVWVTAIGPGRAWIGYLDWVRRLSALSHAPGLLPGHLGETGVALAQWHHWLPAQIPLALIVASAEAFVYGRLTRRTTSRPGLLIAVRRQYVRASLRRGNLATIDGACLGIVMEAGRRVAVSWREATGGVLVTGQDPGAVTRTGLDFAIAAILHRKTVIIIDLECGLAVDTMGDCAAADAHALRSVISASEDVMAPLAVFGSGGHSYQPFVDARPDAAADLLLSMTDWTGVSEPRRAFCADYIATAAEVVVTPTTAPAQQHNIIDELIGLIRPGALASRAAHISDPRLQRRASGFGSQLAADPSATRAMSEQLACMRRSPAWTALCGQSDSDETIDIGLALARRQVLLFPLDPREHGPAGPMIARLVLADLGRALAERSGAPADCVLWINGCEVLGAGPIEAAIAHGSDAGVTAIVGSTAEAAAAALQDQVNVVATCGWPLPALNALSVHVRQPIPRLLRGRQVPR